jgi:hypothetical protein
VPEHAPAPTQTAQEELDGKWLDAVDAAFEAAARARGVLEQRIRLTGAPVALEYAGDAIRDRLAPAFAHLTDAAPAPPELTLRVWDSAAVPPPPLPAVPEGPRGAVYYSAHGAIRIAYQPGLHLLSVLDLDRGVGWFWCEHAAELPYWESSAPFRQILHWWLTSHSMLLLHGASVGLRDRGVLLVGRGGSGKSTSALACLDSELLYAGDDYVAVDDGETPTVYSLFSSGKLEPAHAARLSHLPAPAIDGDEAADEKAVFFVHERYPDRATERLPLRAVLVPRIAGDEARIVPLGAASALRALAPSTLLQLHPAEPQAFARMARLTGRVPTYSFELGPDISAIPRAIRTFLESLP